MLIKHPINVDIKGLIPKMRLFSSYSEIYDYPYKKLSFFSFYVVEQSMENVNTLFGKGRIYKNKEASTMS